MPTARELIIDAYQTSGLRAPTQPVTDDDTVFGLRALNNDVLEVLQMDLNFPPSVLEASFTIAAGQREYTVGTAGTDLIVSLVPEEVISVQRDEGGIYVPLEQIQFQQFYKLSNYSTDTAVPTKFTFIRPSTLVPKIVLLDPPDASYSAKAVFNGVVSSYNLNDQINLPGGYYSLLKYKLVSVLAQGNGLYQDAQMAEARASTLMQQLTNVNTRTPPKLSGSYGGGRYDIFSDGFV